MTEWNPDYFKVQLRDTLHRHHQIARTIKVPKHHNVYIPGDSGEIIYFVESGQVKLLRLSREGKECILNLYTSGDVFGEACLLGLNQRPEVVIAMVDSVVKKISCSKFLAYLQAETLLEEFLRYLARQIIEGQDTIHNLKSLNSEQRLAATLLQLSHKIGKKYFGVIRIESRITHEELSSMIGTTRPRVTHFMSRFQRLGFVEITTDHYLIIKPAKLSEYLSDTI